MHSILLKGYLCRQNIKYLSQSTDISLNFLVKFSLHLSWRLYINHGKISGDMCFKSNLPVLSEGEFCFCIDTSELFIGTKKGM